MIFSVIGTLVLSAVISCKRQPETPVSSAAMEDVTTFRGEVRQHYNNRRFAELEEIASKVRSGKERVRYGDWKIYHFYQAMDCREDEQESMWKLHEQIHREWLEKFPQSITARVAQAEFLTTYAWHARSDATAKYVSEEGWRLFHERLAAARTVLDQSKSLSPACPMWWYTCQTVALGQEWSRGEYDALFASAKAFEPEFFPYDCSRAKYLLPRWHGKPGEWEEVAEKQIKLQGATGSEIYARVVQEQEGYYDNIFQRSAASWRKTRKGFDDLRTHYPDSLELLNTYCRMACIAGDREQARKLFGEIGENKVQSCWRVKGDEYERAKAWAMASK